MMRMSVPPSSRCVAKLCRSVCTVTRLARPAAAQAERQADMQHLDVDRLRLLAAGERASARGRASRQ